MAIFETPEQADALCTLISVGFIAAAVPNYRKPEDFPARTYAKTSSQRQTYIIYHDGQKDQEEDARHAELQARLDALGVPLSFAVQSAGDKPRAPVIFGQTGRSVLQGDILENARGLVNRLELDVNGAKSLPLRGAYVGGLLSGVDKVELLNPSILYCYTPEYREYSENVEQSYQSAKRVTEAVQDFLDEEFKGNACSKKGSSILQRAGSLPERTPMPESTEKAKLFGSVHGMTQSMIHYGRSADSSKVNLELALSGDTNKVASCIPCSIFMWANGVPAAATHFGRGDNWNFPLPIFEEIRMCTGPDDDRVLGGRTDVKNWMNLVWDSYDVGRAHLTQYFKRTETIPSEALSHALNLTGKEAYGKIPLMFLEALTFEGSFLDKLLNTLPAV